MAPDSGRPYTSKICHICHRTFVRGEHLRRHLRTHTKEKPYGCHCGQSFARRDLLTRHERLYHATIANSSMATPAMTANSSLDSSPLNARAQSNGGMTGVTPGSGHDVAHGQPLNSHTDSVTELGEPYALEDNAELLVPPSPMEAMLDISDFFDSVGLDFDHGFDFFAPTELDTSVAPGPLSTLHTAPYDEVDRESQQSHSTPPNAHRHQAEYSWKCIPDTETGEDDFRELKPVSQPWKVDEEKRSVFGQHVEDYATAIGPFRLPSRLSMSRYIAGFVDGYVNHHPFIHMPTFSITKHQDAPELILAVMAVGAQLRYEYQNGLTLYRAGRAIVLHRLKFGQLSRQPRDPGGSQGSTTATSSANEEHQSAPARMDSIKAILLLATFASWQQDQCLVRESLEYQGLLARCIRESGLAETAPNDGDDWHTWARIESDRRVKLSAFCFLNLQSLVFNVPPVLLSNEIFLRLPVTCDEWLAPDTLKWLNARSKAVPVISFQEEFVPLVQSQPRRIPPTSPFGNFVLMHALLQRLVISRQLCFDPQGLGFSSQEAARFECSLHRWREQWCKAPESVLDIRNTKGSLSWTATSLLGLAHVRLHFDLGNQRQVYSGNPQSIATAAFDARPPERGPHLVFALLHAVHALSIPVQLGIEYLANCQAFFWSLQHSFCSFEAAIFLSKWLFMLADDQDSVSLDPKEQQIIRWLAFVVNEAMASVDETQEDEPDVSNGTLTQDVLRFLGTAVVKIFAKMFQKCNNAWPIMRVIGESLHEYSQLLDTIVGPEGSNLAEYDAVHPKKTSSRSLGSLDSVGMIRKLS